MIYFLKILLAFLLTFVSNAFSEVDDYYPYVIDTPEECAMKVAEHNYPFIAWPYQIKPKAYIIVYEDLFDCKRNPFSTCIDFIYCSIDKSSGSYSSYQEQYYSNDHGEDFIGRADFFEECAQNNFYLEKNGKNYCDFPLEYMYSTSSPIKKYPIFFFFGEAVVPLLLKLKKQFQNQFPTKMKKKERECVSEDILPFHLSILRIMSEQTTEQLPSQIIFENLKELLRAKNTAHESMFKFHWKKMWPFCLIWPQVDFERIVRLMGEIRKNVINQSNLVLQAKAKASDCEKEFLKALPAYLNALDASCKCLADAAQWKQDMLLRRIHKEVKLRRDVAEYNHILKAYEDAQGNLVRAGALVQMGWGEIVRAQQKS